MPSNSAMQSVFFRNIFIDSEINNSGTGTQCRVIFPSQSFGIKGKQFMKLKLSTFSMRRNWYNINITNNTFYLFNFPLATNYTQFTIAPGNYTSFATLATAIQASITAVAALAATVVTYDNTTRKFTITLAGAIATSYFVFFQVKSLPVAPAGVSAAGYFNDSFEILGTIPTRDGYTVGSPINGFGTTVGNVAHITPFVGALNSMEAIYLRCNITSNNFQTLSFEKNLPNSNEITSSQIFARIPLVQAFYFADAPFVNFEDQNDLFEMLLQQTSLSTLDFTITDAAGRLITEVSAGQASSGNLNFKMCLRFDIMENVIAEESRTVPLPGTSHSRIPMQPSGRY